MAAPDELDLDPVEEETPPRAKAKAGKGKEPRAKSGKETRAAEEKDARADERTRRDADPTRRKIPYPPSPPDVPEGLTDYADSYVKQQNLLLAGLFVFLIFYIGLVLLFALLGAWSVYALRGGGPLPVIGIVGIVFSSVFFLYLVKGFFKRHPMNKEMHIEITEDEHPVLFSFIYQLCDELGAPLPNKVYVSPDVNAAVMPRTTLLNLFVEPKKDLLIGLGLVNSVNLSEFKAVLAHEFGHFSQSAMASSYTYVASRIIGDLVEGEDWFDRLVNWCKAQDNVISVVGYAIGAPLWVGRKILEQCYKVITLQRLAVSREREFHADLVAVSAAGSNAVVHCLLRTEFGHQCFMQALNDLSTAIDHKLYSNDMYLHQDRASAVVRRKKKEPELGLPPLLKTPDAGKDVEVFDADQEEMEDEIPPMWRTHPSNSDREKNAKERFVPAVVDHRSPWILFAEPADLKERMTYKFYRMVFKIPKNADLADAVKVQKFIDNEHADTTYDPKYKGAYDDRPLEPGELAELNALVRETPWTEERMEKVLAKLYDGCEEHAEAHAELYKEEQSIHSGIVGRPSPKMKRKLDEIKEKQDANWEWFKSFDRRVYLLHVQMAAQVDKETRDELVERYRFQLDVQRLYQESRAAFNKADAYLGAYAAAGRGEIQVSADFAGEVIQVLREQWKALKNIIKDARDIALPAMKNFEEGENLADFILKGKMVPEPPLSYVKGVWIDKLMTQLQGVRTKCFRLHFKSVGGILRLQEEVSAKWKAAREPVAAEVVEDEPVPAEVIEDEPSAPSTIRPAAAGIEPAELPGEPIAAEIIPAEVIEAEVIPAEVIPAEVIPAEVIPAEVIEAEVIEAEVLPPEPTPPAPVAAAPEPSKSMAAFVASVAAQATRELRAPPVARAPELPPVPPEPVAAEVVAEVVAEVIEEPVPATVVPGVSARADVSGTFSLDSGLPLPVKAKAAPVAPAAPVPAAEIFSLDGEEPEPAKPTEVAFSLDMDDHKSAPPAAPAPAPKPAPKPASGVFPAAAAAPVGSTAVPAPAPRPAAPARPPSAPVVEVPPTKPAFGSGVSPALASKRPPIKITMVKPGEKSPLAK